MATKLPEAGDRRIFDAPLHVAHGSDGTVTVFFPDGHRMVLTAEAAERSGAILWRTGVAQRNNRRRQGRPQGRPSRRSGQVIAVDFTDPALHH